MKKPIALFVLFFATAAYAYIPPYWMIASRVADTRNDNFYKIEQDVVFNHGEEPIVIHERWFVYDSNFMRLEIQTKKGFDKTYEATFVYRNNVRSFADSNGKARNQKVNPLFIEPLFHMRNSNDFKNELVRLGLASKDTLNSRPEKFDPKRLEQNKRNKKDDTKSEEPTKTMIAKNPYVELGRVDGTVSYKISAGNDKDSPAIWIEQDQFTVQKLLFPDNSNVRAKDYVRSRGLTFPQQREFHWDNHEAFVRLSTIRTLSKSSKNKELVRTASLKDTKSELPEDSVIRSFYSKFR